MSVSLGFYMSRRVGRWQLSWGGCQRVGKNDGRGGIGGDTTQKSSCPPCDFTPRTERRGRGQRVLFPRLQTFPRSYSYYVLCPDSCFPLVAESNAPKEDQKRTHQLLNFGGRGSLLGAFVVVEGLKSQPQWNGREGRIIKEPEVLCEPNTDAEEDMRYEIRMSAFESIKVKGVNWWL